SATLRYALALHDALPSSRVGAGRGGRACARATLRRGGQPQRHRRAADRFDEIDADLRLHVRPPLRGGRRGRTAPVEQVAEHVPEPAEATAASGPGGAEQVAEVEAARSAAGEVEAASAAGAEQRPSLVVLLPLLRVRQHAVGLGDGREPLRGLGVTGGGVGVVLPRQLAVRAFDLFLRCVGGDAQFAVEVLTEPLPCTHRTSLLPRVVSVLRRWWLF